MFDSERPEAYEKVYQGLKERLAGADLAQAADNLGLVKLGPAVVIPHLGGQYLVDAEGVSTAEGGPAPLNLSIVLAYYMLHGGRGEVADRFVPYRELPGGRDFARNLAITVEGRLARCFSGRAQELARICARLDGRPNNSKRNYFAASHGVSAGTELSAAKGGVLDPRQNKRGCGFLPARPAQDTLAACLLRG